MLRHHHGRQKENEDEPPAGEAQAGEGVTAHAASDQLRNRHAAGDKYAVEKEAQKVWANEMSVEEAAANIQADMEAVIAES